MINETRRHFILMARFEKGNNSFFFFFTLTLIFFRYSNQRAITVSLNKLLLLPSDNCSLFLLILFDFSLFVKTCLIATYQSHYRKRSNQNVAVFFLYLTWWLPGVSLASMHTQTYPYMCMKCPLRFISVSYSCSKINLLLQGVILEFCFPNYINLK